MKHLFTFCACLLFAANLGAQALNPMTWTTAYKAISATEGEIVITATIEKGWHTYSQRPTDAGPISTTILFLPSSQYQLVGKAVESEAHEEFDKAFDAKLFVFAGKAEFRQKVKLLAKPGFSIALKVECTCCNESMCLPPKTVDLGVKTQ